MGLRVVSVQTSVRPAIDLAVYATIMEGARKDGNCRSSSHVGRKDLWPPYMEIHAEFDGLDVLLDVQGT